MCCFYLLRYSDTIFRVSELVSELGFFVSFCFINCRGGGSPCAPCPVMAMTLEHTQASHVLFLLFFFWTVKDEHKLVSLHKCFQQTFQKAFFNYPAMISYHPPRQLS